MAKDMYKYFEDLALTMYRNSVWCGVVWFGVVWCGVVWYMLYRNFLKRQIFVYQKPKACTSPDTFLSFDTAR